MNLDRSARRASPYEARQKPVSQIDRFCRLLGWKGVRPYHMWLPPESLRYHGEFSDEVLFSCYRTTDDNLFIQINEHPGQCCEHQAAINAHRYGLTTGWFKFFITDNLESADSEAKRLLPFLERRNYKSKMWRKEFVVEHPEYVLWQKPKRR
jgi:hypothetical protein